MKQFNITCDKCKKSADRLEIWDGMFGETLVFAFCHGKQEQVKLQPGESEAVLFKKKKNEDMSQLPKRSLHR